MGVAQDNTVKEASDEFSSTKRQAAMTVQLFLDGEGFGPGRIDALWGEFSKKASTRWNEANPDRKIEMGVTGDPSAESISKLGWNKPLTTEYTITEKDAEDVGELPEKPEEMAKLKSLPYTSLMELIAEKFHSYPELILELNNLDSTSTLSVGDTITVPNVANPFDLEGPKSAEGKTGASEGEIFINRAKEILEFRVDGKIALSFPITPGAGDNPAPPGDWKIDVIAWMPEFRYDQKMLDEGERSADAHMLPPGPNNPVGIVWMGINSDGIGLHGTSSPDTIGRSASHGCIRLSNWDAYKLGQTVAVDTKVHIE
jgi:lipoprotein-anchoring transpeptidase ErfK/SrfK